MSHQPPQVPQEGVDVAGGDEMAPCLPNLLLASAARFPHTIAIETDEGCATYSQVVSLIGAVRPVLRRGLLRCGEMAEQAGMPFAIDLVASQDDPPPHGRRADEHIIMVVLTNGIECMATLHAVMLERCAYTFFDSHEPAEKLKTWMSIVAPPLAMTTRSVITRLGLSTQDLSGGPAPCLGIDIMSITSRHIAKEMAGVEPTTTQPLTRSSAHRLAYVIFTSGSTGKPKAVMVQHASVHQFADHYSTEVLDLHHGTRAAQFYNLMFDAHVVDVYTTFCAGATMVIIPHSVKRSGIEFYQLLTSKHIEILSTVPSNLRLVMSVPGADVSRAGLPLLRRVASGGEPMTDEILSAWGDGRVVVNGYGPTEATVASAWASLKKGDKISIGRGLPFCDNVVRDPETLLPVAPGGRGVLFIGGTCLARGYFNDPEKTRDRFVESQVYGRIYNTGDVFSMDADGTLHHLGRADWQVKVRGNRIELEALENKIYEVLGVKTCEARVVGDRLVLFASGDGLSEHALTESAAKLGSAYVVHEVHIIDNAQWEFNHAGKLVRNRVSPSTGAGAHAAPAVFDKDGACALECQIADVISQLRSGVTFDRQSHFINDLGMDSVTLGKMVGMLNSLQQLQHVPMFDFLAAPSVKDVAVLAKMAQEDAIEEGFADASIESESPLDLGEEFLKAVVNHPHRICCEEAVESSTYSQVQELALRVQVALRVTLKQRFGASRRSSRASSLQDTACLRDGEELIILAMPTSTLLFASIIGVVLERCSYCTFDVREAREQLVSWIRVARPAALLTTTEASISLSLPTLHADLAAQYSEVPDVSSFGEGEAPSLVEVDSALAGPAPAKATRPVRAVELQLAYVVFASGSTGTPKAIMVEHSSVLSCLRALTASRVYLEHDRVLQLMPPATGACAGGFWCPLAVGAALCLPPPGVVATAGAPVLAWMRRRGVSVLECAPSHGTIMSADPSQCSADALPTLRLLILACERPAGSAVGRWSAPGRRVLYMYGPSECVVYATMAEMQQVKEPTIGATIAGHAVCHILTDRLEPVKRGDQGTLYIGGPCLPRGYLGDEEETGENFLQTERFGRIYNSGDLVRQGEGGDLIFSGRADNLVKVRGRRVELEYLEAKIASLSGVHHCEARVIKGKQQLALIASGDSLNPATLRAAAAKIGEEYALDVCMLVEDSSWAFTTSGKMKRNHIPVVGAPEHALGNEDGAGFKPACMNIFESIIVECLAPHVTSTQWNRHSHFVTDLGLTPATMPQFMSALSSRLQQEQTLDQEDTLDDTLLFENPSVARLATAIQQALVVGPRASTAISVDILRMRSGAASKRDSGASAYPWLCLLVQSVVLLLSPFLQAALIVFGIRFILPLIIARPLRVFLGVALPAALLKDIFELLLFAAFKWLVVGKYRPGKYPIYGTYFLRHWLVDWVGQRTLLARGEGSGHGGLGMHPREQLTKAIGLKLLGAEVALSACVEADVIGYDLVKVGALSTVAGGATLTAVNFVGDRMVVGKRSIAEGAHVGANTVLSEDTTLLAGAQVDALSWVPPGSVVQGRWSGVPATQVADPDPDRERHCHPESARHVLRSLIFAPMFWLKEIGVVVVLLVVKTILDSYPDVVVNAEHIAENVPPTSLLWIPLVVFGVMVLAQGATLVGTLIACRLLPKARLPMDVSSSSFLGLCVVMKLKLVYECTSLLGDMAPLPAFLRLCGAKVGRGCSFGDMALLPEITEIGDHCFLASANSYLSVVFDQGRVKIGSEVRLGERSFVGNHNIICSGLAADCQVGLNTLVHETPRRRTGLFGNPAVLFPVTKSAAVLAPTRLQSLRRDWITTLLCVFVIPALPSAFTAGAVALDFAITPAYNRDRAAELGKDFAISVAIIAGTSILTWLLPKLMRRCLWAPRHGDSYEYYAPSLDGWFLYSVASRSFSNPFTMEGTMWAWVPLWLGGCKVGRRCFFASLDVFPDRNLGAIGDDVTFDYGAGFRGHTFVGGMLELATSTVGDGCTLMAGSLLNMSSMGDGATLLPSSTTWKGAELAGGKIYGGTPSVATDMRGPVAAAGVHVVTQR